MRRARLPVLVALSLLVAACGPPDPPLDVGVRDYQTDVALSDEASSASEDPLAAALSLLGLPPPPYADEDAATPSPCEEPAADAPSDSVPGAVDAPPAPAAYASNHQRDGTGDATGVTEAAGEHTVKRVEATPDGFAFQVVAEHRGSTARSRYEVRDDGLYLTNVESHASDDSRASFDPVPDLKVLALPAEVDESWQARGADPHTGREVSFTGEVVGAVHVDVCGAAVPAWDVRLTEGTIRGQPADGEAQAGDDGGAGDAATVRFEASLAVAAQHGGLPVRSGITASPVDGDATETSDDATETSGDATQASATVAEEPEPAVSPDADPQPGEAE